MFSSISVISPVISGKLITAVSTQTGNITVLLIIFLAVSGVRILISQADQYCGSTLKIRQKQQMRKYAFNAFLRRENIEKSDISMIGSFINNDIPGIAESYILGTVDIIKCAWLILFSVLSLISIHWVLALIIIAVSAMIVVVPNAFREKSGQAREAYSEKMSSYNNGVNSAVNGNSLIKVYRCKPYIEKNIEVSNKEVTESEKVMLSKFLTVYGATAFFQVLKTVVILVCGVYLISKRSIDVGELVAVIQISEMIGAPIEVLAHLRHRRNEVLPITEKYVKMVSVKDDYKVFENVMNEDMDITVKNVCYSVNNENILNNANAVFKSKGKYMIVGESGSGKSSLLKMIANIEKNYTGEICYGHQNIKQISDDVYYGKVGVVFQEPYLFYMTLKENITLGRNMDDDFYRQIIEKLNLKYLLERYDGTDITPEIMQKLSGGEKQRISIARAMAGKPQIYLLDEITSSLDSENSRLVEEIFLKENATVINVSHKQNPELMALYDNIYTIKNHTVI